VPANVSLALHPTIGLQNEGIKSGFTIGLRYDNALIKILTIQTCNQFSLSQCCRN